MAFVFSEKWESHLQGAIMGGTCEERGQCSTHLLVCFNFLKLFFAEYLTQTPGSVIHTHTEKSYFYSGPHLPLLPCPTEVIMFITLLYKAFSMQTQAHANKYSLLSSLLLNCNCGRSNVMWSPNSPFFSSLRNSGRLSPSLLCC